MGVMAARQDSVAIIGDDFSKLNGPSAHPSSHPSTHLISLHVGPVPASRGYRDTQEVLTVQ